MGSNHTENRKGAGRTWTKSGLNNWWYFAKHGAIPEENVLGQKFLVSAVLFTDTRKAGRNDQLDQTISYGRASKFMERYLREHTFQLIESAAEKLAEELLLMYPDSLKSVELEIRKPWAPIGLPLQYVSVRITRGGIGIHCPGSNRVNRLAILPGRWRPLESFGSAVWAGYPALLKRLLTG